MTDSEDPAADAAAQDASDGASAATDTDAVAGGLFATMVASVVTATVAFALHLDGSTTVAVPGGVLSAFAAGFWLLGLAGAAAAANARYRRQGTRSVGFGVAAIGCFGVAALGAVTVGLGGLTLTGGTIGIVVAVAGLNLVVLDHLG